MANVVQGTGLLLDNYGIEFYIDRPRSSRFPVSLGMSAMNSSLLYVSFTHLFRKDPPMAYLFPRHCHHCPHTVNLCLCQIGRLFVCGRQHVKAMDGICRTKLAVSNFLH